MTNLDTLRALQTLLDEDVRLQALADSYDDDYDAAALPASLIGKCGDAREKLLKALPLARPALAALIAEFEKAVGLLAQARDSLRVGTAGGHEFMADRIAAFLAANEQESA